jgi:hypothetical protein
VINQGVTMVTVEYGKGFESVFKVDEDVGGDTGGEHNRYDDEYL